MPEWAADNFLLGLVLTGGVSAVLALFAKFCPKKKLVGWIKAPCTNLGRAISKALILRLGKKGAERVEEGIIVTILEVGEMAFAFVKTGLLEDNNGKK